MKNAYVVRAWSLTLLWISIIALESFKGSSATTGSLLWPLLHFLFPAMTAAQFDIAHSVLRKTGHFLGYGTLAFLFYRAWWTTLRARTSLLGFSWRAMFRNWLGRAAVLALLGTLAIAGLDEWHQTMEPGRGPSVYDVALDETGGALFLLLVWGFGSIGTRREQHEPSALVSN